MKRILIFALIFLALSGTVKAQQEGQTCLPVCLHQLDPSRTINQYIQLFNDFTKTNQDVKRNGSQISYNGYIDFIASVADTGTFNRLGGVLGALDSGYQVLAIIAVRDDNDIITHHQILINAYKAKEKGNVKKTYLSYYDPAVGWDETISLYHFLNDIQIFSIPVKPKDILQSIKS